MKLEVKAFVVELPVQGGFFIVNPPYTEGPEHKFNQSPLVLIYHKPFNYFIIIFSVNILSTKFEMPNA